MYSIMYNDRDLPDGVSENDRQILKAEHYCVVSAMIAMFAVGGLFAATIAIYPIPFGIMMIMHADDYDTDQLIFYTSINIFSIIFYFCVCAMLLFKKASDARKKYES